MDVTTGKLKLTVGAEVVDSPKELYWRIRSALMKAVALWVSHMLTYIDDHVIESDRSKPKGMIPAVTGNLWKSAVGVIGSSKVTGLKAEFNYGFDANYAKYVDQGRPKGKPPPKGAIEEWCREVGIPEKFVWAVVNSIAQGTKGYYFWAPMDAEAMRYYRVTVERSMRENGLDFSWGDDGTMKIHGVLDSGI